MRGSNAPLDKGLKMTSSILLIRVRTILDESSAGFYTDAEIYSALSEAQREVVNIILNIYHAKSSVNQSEKLPEVLMALIEEQATNSLTTPNNDLPDDFRYLLNCTYRYSDADATAVPCYIKQFDKKIHFNNANTYMAGTQTAPVCYVKENAGQTAREIVFSPNFHSQDGGGYTAAYIKEPPDIDASVQPCIPASAHEAVVQYAAAEMLKKDEKYNQSSHCYNQFMQMVQGLYY